MPIEWTILETKETVDALNEAIVESETESEVRFTARDLVVDDSVYQLILMNNAIHIFEEPRAVLTRIFNARPDYVLIGDVPVLPGLIADRCAIVKPPLLTRRTRFSFPFWLFPDDIWDSHRGAYKLVSRWLSGNETIVDGKRLVRFSFLFRRG